MLGISYVGGTHMLRKTSGTLARKLTIDVYTASKLLGHSSVNITEKYYQEELDEDKHQIVKKLWRRERDLNFSFGKVLKLN